MGLYWSDSKMFSIIVISNFNNPLSYKYSFAPLTLYSTSIDDFCLQMYTMLYVSHICRRQYQNNSIKLLIF